MKLPINDNYQISTDTMNWRIDKKKMKKDKDGNPVEIWESIKFYSSISGAVNGLNDMLLMTSDCETLAEALEFNKNTLTLLVQALSPEYTVTFAGNLEKAND